MTWPNANDYNEAVQNLGDSVGDEELRAGQLATTPLGLPMLWSGNFADVYKIYCPATDNAWALKCFTRQVPGLRDRYRSITEHLEQARLPFTVDFQYLERGIRVGGTWFPALKMRWVEGLALNQFVEEHLRRPKNLNMLLELWVKLAARLREARVAHADLQHGNVILVPMSRGQLALRLIDYDGMHVPKLAGIRSGELGHPAFQHPQRLREGTYNAEVDRFSHLAIYCAIRCLTVGRRDLWRRFNNGDNLLFREPDFQKPGTSEVFHTLWNLREGNTRPVVGRLILGCQQPLEQVPLLGEVVTNGKVLPLTRDEEAEVESILAAEGLSEAPPVPTPSTDAERDEKRPWWATQPLSPAEGRVPSIGISGGSTSSATTPTTVSRPRREGAMPPGPEFELLRRAVWPLGVALRWTDHILARIAGEGNAILHNFVRIVAWVGVTLLLSLTVKLALPLIGNMIAMLAESSAPEVPLVALILFIVIVILALRSAPVEEPPETPEAESPPLWEEYYEGSKEVEEPPETPQTESPLIAPQKVITNSIGMKLVAIPAGEFLMGWPEWDRDASADQKPQHRVRITNPFYLGMYEVTQAEYERVMGTNPSHFKDFKDDAQRPVEWVSWDDATEFCRRLSQQEGKTYRLPTEAEWEYACRAGSTTRFSFGDEEASLEDYAWFSANSDGKTHPVGQKKPNGWGLYDMHGNVWEWCQDWYDSDYYGKSPTDDPTGPTAGSGRVLRGGSWSLVRRRCRSVYRSWFTPDYRYLFLGLRVASVAVDVSSRRTDRSIGGFNPRKTFPMHPASLRTDPQPPYMK